ncbi:MAG: alpha/beta fold hydrolase [Chloroflexota bacterium]|jgi:pimeloyl-ACP methyl ester carboxylesterase
MNEIVILTKIGRISALETGKEMDPLVLGLHGWSQRNGRHIWEPLMEPLADAGFHVVSVDMPGWGQSPSLSDRPIERNDAHNSILAILTALGSEHDAVLMGKSWGGGLALDIALDFPQRVSKLILSAPAFSDFARLPALRQPLLLAWAEDDPVIPIQFAVHYQSVPTLKNVTYATGGHNAATKNAGEFAPVAVTFLQESSSLSAS